MCESCHILGVTHYTHCHDVTPLSRKSQLSKAQRDDRAIALILSVAIAPTTHSLTVIRSRL